MTSPKRQKWSLAVAALLLGALGLLIGMALEHRKIGQSANMPPEWGLSGRPQAPQVRQTQSGNYLAMQVAVMRQDFDTAAREAERMHQRGELDEQTIGSALRVMVAAGRIEQAESLLEQMHINDDLLAMQLDALRLLKAKKFSASEERLKQMPALLFNVEQLVVAPSEAWLTAAKFRQQQQEQQDASGAPEALTEKDIEVIFEPLAQLEAIDAISGFATFQKALLYDWLGEKEKARAGYDKLQQDNHSLPFRTAEILLNFYLRQGDLEAAKALKQHYEEQHPESALKFSPLPKSAQEAMLTQPIIASPQAAVAELYFTVASLLFEDDPTLRPILFLQLALSLRPDFPPAQMLLAAIYERQERHEAAVAVYQSMDKETALYKQGRLRVALNYHAADRKEDAVALLRQIVADEPHNAEAVMLLGDMLRHAQKYGDSIAVYSHALKNPPQDGWNWQFFYKYGMTLERAGRWQEAEPILKKALELEPEQPDVLNYLGYSWLEHNVNLDEAKSYIEKANTIDPGQAHIIDSLGWVYFKLGQYDKALNHLEQAIELAPQDATLNDHLGDVYWRLGRHNEARFQWQRAITFEAEDVQALEVKIRDGLPALPDKPATK